jgi:hypothetical protein
MKYGVYTRAFLEAPYLDFFIEHYSKLGFEKIIILLSDYTKYNVDEKYLNIVEIHVVNNIGNQLLPKYDYLVKNSGCDWMLCIDIDEILLLHNRYLSISDYVESKIVIDKDVNIIYFRWGMIEKYDNELNNDFNYILNNYNIYSNVHIKSMINVHKLDSIYHPHMSKMKTTNKIYFEDNILINNYPQQTISEKSYKDSILIHLHTRSINNIVIKAFNTVLDGKSIMNISKFITLINTLTKDSENNNLLELFKQYIGTKATKPFEHSKKPLIHVDINNFSIYDYKYKVTNLEIEEKYIVNLLNYNNIDKDKYHYFITKLHGVKKA